MIVLIDNYDSFAYNLYQLIGSLRPDIAVYRNDKIDAAGMEKLSPDAIVISPGPGRPENTGNCREIIRVFAGRAPILGVCLGHQTICDVYGATVSYAKKLMHGKTSPVQTSPDSRLFAGIPAPIQAARYHSLAALRETLPPELKVTAWTEDGEVMAVEDQEKNVYGIQFHPESVLTPDGKKIMENFLKMVRPAS